MSTFGKERQTNPFVADSQVRLIKRQWVTKESDYPQLPLAKHRGHPEQPKDLVRSFKQTLNPKR
jgi:hypothetical protein